MLYSYPAHCSSCEFDLCDNCIKQYTSTHHPGHVFYRADSNALYPQYKGNWFCDRCRQGYNSQHAPYHCSQCEYDLCESCMKGEDRDTSNAGKIFHCIPYIYTCCIDFRTPSHFQNCLTKYMYNVGKLICTEFCNSFSVGEV